MFSRWYGLFFLTGVLIDQLTKHLADRFLGYYVPWTIIPGFLDFQLVHNYGAAYGIFEHQRLFLAIISATVFCVCFLFRYEIGNTRLARIGLCFLLMGTFGNLIDRVHLGYIVDFINIHIFPVFNIADILINAGIVCFLIDLIHYRDEVPGK